MPIVRLDHVTVCTRDMPRSVAFYRDIVGLEPGPRPRFSFDGAWLYANGVPVVHIVERDASGDAGAIDHFAFAATGLAAYLDRLRAKSIAYKIQPLPPGVPQSGTQQLFFHDPDGARIEIDFPANEIATPR